MRTRFGLFGRFAFLGGVGLLAGLGLSAGCQAPPKNVAVSDIRVMVFDETGRAPRDIPAQLRSEIPSMAAQTGLIGQRVGDPGERVLLQGHIVDFPTIGRDQTQSTWINAGPITVEWTLTKEDGEALGTATITTHPRDADDAPMCPFVFTQSREVVAWLRGR